MTVKNPSAKPFLQLLKTLHWPKKIVVLALFLALISTAAGLIIPLVTKDFVDSLTSSLFNWKMAVLLFFIFVIQAAMGGFSHYLLSYIGETVVADLRKQLWHRVLHLPVSYFDEHETGETMSRITQDTMTLKNLVSDQLVSFITGIISVVGAVFILLYLDWKMTLIMLVSVPLSLAIMMPLGRYMHRIAKSTQQEMANFTSHLGRVLGDIRLVKAYRAESIEETKGAEKIHSLFGFGLKEAKVQAIISPVMTFIMMMVLVVILGYGGAQVSREVLSAGTLVAIIFLLFQIIMPFAQMAQFFTSFQKAVGATERIQVILQLPIETSEDVQSITTTKIEFKDVDFSYEENKPILQGLSFQAKPGTVTAFVGPSGGGKTTIFSLLERFYDPDAGLIRIDGKALSAISLQELRGKIGYVSQESPLLSGSILDNIIYGLTVPPPLEEVKRAAEFANAASFIEEMPEKYQTLVGERGIKLSGGQRQRIAIARALLHNPAILLLDEATSSLDSQSEAHVQEALDYLMEGRTTFVIAHRLSTIQHADQILFVENGTITGSGTHEQLYKKHALYRQFADGQGLVGEENV